MKALIKKLLKEGLSRKHYIGQCDILRHKSDTNELYWYDMMKNKREITFERFLNSVDFTPVLDEDETAEGYIRDQLRQDPSICFKLGR